MKIGLNAVARSIQQKSVSSCLLAGDVSSDLLISHLVTMAATRGIPILIIPTLKHCTSKTLGFPSAALGIMVCSFYFRSLMVIHTLLLCAHYRIQQVPGKQS